MITDYFEKSIGKRSSGASRDRTKSGRKNLEINNPGGVEGQILEWFQYRTPPRGRVTNYLGRTNVLQACVSDRQENRLSLIHI